LLLVSHRAVVLEQKASVLCGSGEENLNMALPVNALVAPKGHGFMIVGLGDKNQTGIWLTNA
jgi:hypothetical protein